MRQSYFRWCLAVGMLLAHAPFPLCAQESPIAQESALIPPWGQDLDEESPSARTRKREEVRERPHRVRFDADYLLWWTKTNRIPQLLTTGPTTDPRPGSLDSAFTRVIYGDAIDFEDRTGGRFTLEAPWRGSEVWSVSATYFLLGARDVGAERSSAGNPILARPFFNVIDNREDSSLTTYPGLASGSISIISDSFLHGAEANVHCAWWPGEPMRVTLLAGFRYLDLHENLTILEISTIDPAAAQLAGRSITVWDRFEGGNEFYGGQVGARLDWVQARWLLSVTPKVALGSVRENLTIRGRTTIDTAPATDVPVGLLALASNSGRTSQSAFAVVPEISAKFGVRVSERLTLFGGYTFLAWTEIVRPGDNVDRNLNPNLIPTSARFGGPGVPAQPANLFRTSDYWAQGMTLGIEFRY